MTDTVVVTATSVTSPTVFSDTARITSQAYVAPEISLFPQALEAMLFSGGDITQTLTISNGNGVTLTFDIAEAADWLSVEPGSGEVGTSSSVPVQVSMDTAGMPAGDFNTTLQVSSNDPDEPLIEVPVTMTVVDLPIEGLSAENNSPTLPGTPTTLSATIDAGTNVVYAWDFGDGELGSGQVVTHTYTAVGGYTATVTATNTANSLSETTVVTVTAETPSYWQYLPFTVKSQALEVERQAASQSSLPTQLAAPRCCWGSLHGSTVREAKMNKKWSPTCCKLLGSLLAAFFGLGLAITFANGAMATPQPTPEGNLLVTTLEDELNTDGDCSLREAIEAANTNAPVDACPAGDAVITDTITFEVAGTITVTSQLSVTAGGPLVVDGESSITVSGGETTPIWWVEAGQLGLLNIIVTSGDYSDQACTTMVEWSIFTIAFSLPI